MYKGIPEVINTFAGSFPDGLQTNEYRLHSNIAVHKGQGGVYLRTAS